MKNYYLILEVGSDATQEEIRAAYRRLAKELHPDHYEGGNQPFLALQEAYAALGDPARRRAYDQSLQAARTRREGRRVQAEPLRPASPAPGPLIPEGEPPFDLGRLSITRSPHNYSPSFDEIFDRLWQNFSPTRPRFQEPKSLNVELVITPLQAFRGGRVQLMIPVRLTCPTCRGRGGLGFFECLRCAGAGVVEGEYPVTVTFPPGVPTNYAVELPLDRLEMRSFYLTVIFKVSERF
jgi:DnaJ-class molecular chaperone